MVTDEVRRRPRRVECCIPVRLSAQGHTLMAETRDISRMGARIRLRLEQLGLNAESSFEDVAQRITETLCDVAVAAFHPEVLGNLVKHGVRVVRIARCADDPGSVDLGCLLRVPLGDDEVGALGLDLDGEEPIPAEAHETNGCEQTDAAPTPAKDRYAYLWAESDRPGQPIHAETARMDEEGFVVRFPQVSRLPLMPERFDIGSLLHAFVEAYGNEVGLLVVEERRPLWSGPVRVRALELGPSRKDLVLHLQATTPLDEAARARLNGS